MKSVQKWSSHLKDPKERREFEALVLSANAVLTRLSNMLETKTIEPKKPDYEKAAWPYFQADSNGYNRALEEIKQLLPLTSE